MTAGRTVVPRINETTFNGQKGWMPGGSVCTPAVAGGIYCVMTEQFVLEFPQGPGLEWNLSMELTWDASTPLTERLEGEAVLATKSPDCDCFRYATEPVHVVGPSPLRLDASFDDDRADLLLLRFWFPRAQEAVEVHEDTLVDFEGVLVTQPAA